MIQVVRIYRQSRRVIYEGDDRQKADAVYDKEWKKMHSGDLLMHVDQVQERASHCGYNRTRW